VSVAIEFDGEGYPNVWPVLAVGDIGKDLFTDYNTGAPCCIIGWCNSLTSTKDATVRVKRVIAEVAQEKFMELLIRKKPRANVLKKKHLVERGTIMSHDIMNLNDCVFTPKERVDIMNEVGKRLGYTVDSAETTDVSRLRFIHKS
tara:strand:+ start:895 stop:1329 length:435 start_codon:yes stop_codon:yes gene_type:complete